MNYRLATLAASKSYAADGSDIIDIDIQDPISHLVIELAITSGDSVMDGTPAACLTSLTIVDGSEVLFNLNGMCAEAVDWYHSGGKQRANYNYFMVGGCQRFIVINFGRHFWDELLAFDPTRYRNPQLKFSLDIDAGGCSASAVAVQVWAAIFDQKDISPIGFLMTKEVKAYTLTSGGHEYTEMPKDHPYRAFFLQSLLAGTEPNQTITNIKLSEDRDKRIIVDHGSEDILRTIQMVQEPVRESFFCTTGGANQYKYIMPTTRVTAHVDTWDVAPSTQGISLYDGDGGRLKTIASGAGANVMISTEGWLPHAVWQIPFGDQQDIDDWYDVVGIGSLIADIKAAAVTHTARIFLQQLKRY